MRYRMLWTAITLLAAAAPAFGQSYAELVGKARALYQEKHYEASARQFEEAFRVEAGSPEAYYDAACSWALAGHVDQAIEALRNAMEHGYRNVEWLTMDQDLATLHDDSRWPTIVELCRARQEKYLETVNRELYGIYQADQADRHGDIDWSAVSPRDSARRVRVKEMIEAGQLTVRDDFIHAAFVFQHGDDSTSYKLANELALRAVALDSTSMNARWIAAATMDRYLMSVGRPQIYGTQYRRGEDGVWTQAPYDTTAISDAERARWGVPPLAEQRASLRRFGE